METYLLSAEEPRDIRKAGELLLDGRIIAFPTETVYGLGARADCGEAVARLRRVKKRPSGQPFSLLIAGDFQRYARPSRAAEALAGVFWPGPLTLVLPDGKGGSVGLRVPDCPVTLALLKAVGLPVAAPSANISGRPPATTAREVMNVFKGAIAAVLDGGAAQIGESSTVVRVGGHQVQILREGAISRARIFAVLRDAGVGC